MGNRFKVGDKVWSFETANMSGTGQETLLEGEIIIAPDTEDDGQFCHPYQVAFTSEGSVSIPRKVYAESLFASKNECIESRLMFFDKNIEMYRGSIQDMSNKIQNAEQQIARRRKDIENFLALRDAPGVCSQCKGTGVWDKSTPEGFSIRKVCDVCHPAALGMRRICD